MLLVALRSHLPARQDSKGECALEQYMLSHGHRGHTNNGDEFMLVRSVLNFWQCFVWTEVANVECLFEGRGRLDEQRHLIFVVGHGT